MARKLAVVKRCKAVESTKRPGRPCQDRVGEVSSASSSWVSKVGVVSSSASTRRTVRPSQLLNAVSVLGPTPVRHCPDGSEITTEADVATARAVSNRPSRLADSTVPRVPDLHAPPAIPGDAGDADIGVTQRFALHGLHRVTPECGDLHRRRISRGALMAPAGDGAPSGAAGQ